MSCLCICFIQALIGIWFQLSFDPTRTSVFAKASTDRTQDILLVQNISTKTGQHAVELLFPHEV